MLGLYIYIYIYVSRERGSVYGASGGRVGFSCADSSDRECGEGGRLREERKLEAARVGSMAEKLKAPSSRKGNVCTFIQASLYVAGRASHKNIVLLVAGFIYTRSIALYVGLWRTQSTCKRYRNYAIGKSKKVKGLAKGVF
ncbi:hypothetical protein K435DRAFT_799511 [Dendrothele bispora CBS 962.96]|uniref:Uncharacterized protein n=1 Tax=Dendrothele bispora (strain CBS 962.96) TaxID=1314807 RepID=A0A4S8LWA7_DENBC|nr:hypothetical protein K435DRAFT_799511 [Dendrothele bispora CBS 962.96]